MRLAVCVVSLQFCACVKHCSKERSSPLSCIQIRMQFYSDKHSRHRQILVMELEAGKPAHLAY